jgi:hypothetical protein
MKKIIIIFVFSFLLLYSEGSAELELEKISDKYKIDFYIKSDRGWLRLFNNKKRLEKYGIFMTEEEVEFLKRHFKQKIKSTNKRSLK